MNDMVLDVKNLQVEFHGELGNTVAVSSLSIQVNAGEIVGVVGESGSGKSTLCLAVMQLFQGTAAHITNGEIVLNGRDILDLPNEELRKIRGGEVGMIFQEPMTSLNPMMTVEKQITRVLRLHDPNLSRQECRNRVVELLQLVGIPSPEARMKDYPHLLSGGMRQRVVIAMALANRPQLLLCDEPTTALDVTIQAQVLQLIRELCHENGSSALFVTHDLGVIAQIADRVAIMYSGKIVESAPVRELFRNPLHPYTKGLLASIPSRNLEENKLPCIPGTVTMQHPGQKGCAFAPRCAFAQPRCYEQEPVESVCGGHTVRCFCAKQGGGS